MNALRIAIDFGSENITVYVEGKGIVFCKPSCVLADSFSGKILADGPAVPKLKGKHNSSSKIIFYIVDGKIVDYKNSVLFFTKIFNKICFGKVLRPYVMICVPENISDLDKRTICEVLKESGAGKIAFIDRSIASLTGTGINSNDSKGHVICDIGSNYTQCSMIAHGRIIMSSTKDVGCNDFSQSLKSYILREKNIEISDITAEELKNNIGSVIPRNEELSVEICGKNTVTSYPDRTEITSNEILNSFRKCTDTICEAIRQLIENSTPELCSDIIDNGIVLTGEAANLYGLDLLIKKATGIDTVKPESPDLCAALGMGILLKNYDFKNIEDNFYS